MLRNRLMAAAAVTALFAAPAAFAQETQDTQPQQQPATEAPAETTPAEATRTEAVQGETVVDKLRAEGRFTTLLSALEQAQLTETLTTQPAISIFAPTDEAFAALPAEERERLMAPENVNELRQLLLYHVIVADVNSSQIQGAQGAVETAARSRVQLDGTGDAIRIDDATVVQADIDASNGAVFAIDKVLNPANSQAAMGDEEAAAPPRADEATIDEAPATVDEVTPPVDEAAPPTDEVVEPTLEPTPEPATPPADEPAPDADPVDEPEA